MRKFLYIISIIFLLLSFQSCKDDIVSPHASLSELEEAYKSNSLFLLEEFLKRWKEDVKPLNPSQRSSIPDTIKNLYEIFKIFYNPFNLERYGEGSRKPEFGNIYEGQKYIIIPDKIRYSFSENYESSIVYQNFRPAGENFSGINILFLTDHYKAILDSFFNKEGYSEINKRLQFLNQKLKIIPGHWFGFHYLTHPEISLVIFNNSMDSANIHFRIIYEGGEAIMKKNSGNWKMIHSKLTWIE